MSEAWTVARVCDACLVDLTIEFPVGFMGNTPKVFLECHYAAWADQWSSPLNFLDFIHKGEKGNFYGEEESRTFMRDLLRCCEFNSPDEVVSFTVET